MKTMAEKRTRKPPPVRTVRVEEMDPKTFIGVRTGVQRVFRVKETLDDKIIFHVVFFDQYGWYCDHGIACTAVADCKAVK